MTVRLTFEEAQAALKAALDCRLGYPQIYKHGADALRLRHAGYWSSQELKKVAEALGTDKIDAQGSGCSSCGFGDEIIVRDILKDS